MNTKCTCGLEPDDCHPDCPHGDPLPGAIFELRRYQRHDLLRRYGENGHVLPQSLTVSRALDLVIDRAEAALSREAPPISPSAASAGTPATDEQKTSPLPEGLDLAELKRGLAAEADLIDAGMNIDDGRTVEVLRAANAAIDRLLSELETAGLYTEAHERLDDLARESIERAEKAEADLSCALEALRPFAEFARAILHDEDRKDDHIIVGKVVRDPAGDWHGRITFGDCRRATEVFSSLSKREGEDSSSVDRAASVASQPDCSAAQRSTGEADLAAVLDEIEDYLEDREDCSIDSDGHHPNREMQLLAQLREARS